MRGVVVWMVGLTLLVALPGCPRGPESLVVDGLTRTFRVHVPEGLNETAPVPIVVGLHPFLGTGRIASRTMNFEPVADREGFIVVYPDGIQRAWRYASVENPGAPLRSGVDDVKFLRALIEHMKATHNIDPRRVYVTGYSNGGFMSHRIANDMSDVVAAIAPVCATLTEEAAAAYAPPRPVPVVMICGVDDPLIPWEGGTLNQGPRASTQVLSAEASAARWAALNGCNAEPTRTLLDDVEPNDGTRVERIAFDGCHESADVVLYGIQGGGHTWPGTKARNLERLLGKVSHDLDATEVIWEFFKNHPGSGPEVAKSR